MTEVELFDILRAALWAGFLVCLPILAAALLVGLGIGLFQALTSIQEMTLTFVPKLAALLIVFWIAMGFMTTTLIDFFHTRVIAAIGGA